MSKHKGKHYYACTWWYGVATYQCTDGSIIDGRTVYRFHSQAERDAWADRGAGHTTQPDYRERLLLSGITAHQKANMRCGECLDDIEYCCCP
jgi:hypothetical protein